MDAADEVAIACATRDGGYRLELGSGYNPTPGYLRYDLNPNCPVDWVGDAERLPFAPGTFEALRAVDVLEHISYRNTAAVLAEWRRVMRPGGELFVMVPDAETIMVRYAERPAQLVVPHLEHLPPIVSAAWRIMGGHLDDGYAKEGDDWRWNAHYAMFSESSLRWYLTEARFDVLRIERNGHPNLLATAVAR